MFRNVTGFSLLPLFAAALLIFFAAPAVALELHEAKAQGVVGEANSGYLGAVKSPPSAEVAALLQRVNQQRRNKFEATAKANQLSVDQVAARFYQRAVQATKPGQYYQNAAGQWLRK